jgi:hypothetical protein
MFIIEDTEPLKELGMVNIIDSEEKLFFNLLYQSLL